jgi:hypothetical protein
MRYHSYDGTFFDIYLDDESNPLAMQGKPEWDRETGWGVRVLTSDMENT